jgi:hypothetical protein
MPHDHRFTIADDEAVQVLLDKMLGGGTRQKRREKLLKALDEASRHYENTTQKQRQAFFPWTVNRLRSRVKALVVEKGQSRVPTGTSTCLVLVVPR